MQGIWAVDWRGIFVPSGSVLELVIRGSLMYLLILAALRVFRRDAGSMAMADILVVVLIADAAQNGMAGEYSSLTEGAALVGTIFAWNYALDWLSFRNRLVYWLLHAPPLLLISRGRIQHANLRSQLITRADLREQLREQGIEEVADVKSCWLEGDGRISVIKMKEEDDQPSPTRERPTGI